MACSRVSRVSGRCGRAAERLLEVRHCLAMGRARHGLVSRLPAVHQGLVPHLAPQGMVRQAFDLLCQPVLSERFQSLDDASMQHSPPLVQQATVGHLVRQGMLEGVFQLGEEARLVQELRSLEVGEVAVQLGVWQVGNGGQEGTRHLRANNRGGLQQALGLGWQPVDAGRQHGLHGRRHLDAVQRLRQAIGASLTHQPAGLDQRAHALFQEKGIASRARNQQRGEWRQARVVSQERLQDCRRHSPGAGGRAAVACSRSCYPSRADTRAGS